MRAQFNASIPETSGVRHFPFPRAARTAALALVLAWTAAAPAAVLHVDRVAKGDGSGSSWVNACTRIQAAVDLAQADDEIWVRRGAYPEAVVLKDNLNLLGGFAGSETSRDLRDPAKNPTTINGSTARNGSPAYHVVTLQGVRSVVIDGFTILGGAAVGTATGTQDMHGGGILLFNVKDNVTVSHCRITGNRAADAGGGVYLSRNLFPEPQSRPMLRSCTIDRNQAATGGGIALRNHSLALDLISVAECTATGNGGGLACTEGTFYLASSEITSNTANQGAGLFIADSPWSPVSFGALPTVPFVAVVTLRGNRSALSGAGLYCTRSTALLYNGIFEGNSAGASGGGLLARDSQFVAINALLAGNTAPAGGAVHLLTTGASTSSVPSGGILNNCTLADNTARWAGALFVEETPTSVTNSVFANNSGPALLRKGRDFRLFLRNNLFDRNNLFTGGTVDYRDDSAQFTGGETINALVPLAHNNRSGDPLFVRSGVNRLTGTWTKVTVSQSAPSLTWLEDAGASFDPAALLGKPFFPNAALGTLASITSCTATAIRVAGNLSAIAGPGNAYLLPLYAPGDYQLQADSAAVDCGDSNADQMADEDLLGRPRIVFQSVDAGAYEFDPPPLILSTLFTDRNNNGVLEAGEKLVLVMNRAVHLNPDAPLSASHFFLPVTGDSLGGRGFAAAISPFNPRHLTLALGTGAVLRVPGRFAMFSRSKGKPSGIDLAASRPPHLLLSSSELDAIDGGVPGKDDAAVDIEYNFLPKSANLGAAGGILQIADSPDAFYTRHTLYVAPGTLPTLQKFTLRPASLETGIAGAIQIDAAPLLLLGQNRVLAADPIYTLRLEYKDSDVDLEGGRAEASMKICQWIEGASPGWVKVPGTQVIDREQNTATVPMSSLNPNNNGVGILGAADRTPAATDPRQIFAVLPGATIEPVTFYIRPQAGASARLTARALVAQAKLQVAGGGDYQLHEIEVPNYALTTNAGTGWTQVSLSAATLLQRYSALGTSFPAASSALFVVATRNSSGQPIAFTAPSHVRIQFMDGTKNAFNDLLDLHGIPGAAFQMRGARDMQAGADVDFQLLPGLAQTVDAAQGTVTVRNAVNLTDYDGTGTWGAVADPAVLQGTPAGRWTLYP